jgi:Cu-processing system permease protein
MNLLVIARIARQELLVNVRNKWTVIFAVVFGVLIVGVSYVGIMAEGYSGMQNFTRTSASMLNLVLYIVPLVALVMGTISFTSDRGTTELLLSQPVFRGEVLLGKILGLFISLSLSMLLGFAASCGVISSVTGTGGLPRYVMFVLLSLLLALVFLVVAVVIAIANKRKSRSFGVALFAWFFFVLFYDLIVLGVSLFFKGQAANTILFLSLFGNPVDMVRVASLIILDNVTIFGAAGAALLRFLGGSGLSVALLVGSLLVWIGVPVALSHRWLNRQDI